MLTALRQLLRPSPKGPYPPAPVTVGLAFAAIYLIWGSTFWVALVGLETLPPYLMMSIRLLLAGALLGGLSRLRRPRPALLTAWPRNAACGILILGLGSSSVVWAEQYLPSSLAAMLVTTVPLWLAVLDRPRWARYRREKGRLLGLGLGVVGVVGLFGGALSAPAALPLGPRYWLAVGVVLAGSLCTATGSLLTRYWPAPAPATRNAAAQLLAAGVFCGLVSAGVGEWTHFSLAQVSHRSGWALAYTVVFGSVVAYLAYLWLLQVRPPAVVGTYAYVNPMVAVLLGGLLAHEPIAGPQLLALAVILVGVALINRPGAADPVPGATPAPACAPPAAPAGATSPAATCAAS